MLAILSKVKAGHVNNLTIIIIFIGKMLTAFRNFKFFTFRINYIGRFLKSVIFL